MKRGLKQKSCIFLVMALVFFTGKAALAESPFDQCDTDVTGRICLIPDDGSYIKISQTYDCDDTDSEVFVYGIPFNYLQRVYDLQLNIDDDVELKVHVCPTSQEDEQLKVCVINGITVFPPSAREDRASADDDGSQGKYGQGRF